MLAGAHTCFYGFDAAKFMIVARARSELQREPSLSRFAQKLFGGGVEIVPADTANERQVGVSKATDRNRRSSTRPEEGLW